MGGFYGFAWGIVKLLGFLPVWTLPEEFISSLQSVSGYVGVVDNFLPTGTFFLIIGLMLALEGTIMVYKIIQWVIKKIPGIS